MRCDFIGRQTGSSLIEVIVSMLILAVGMMAGLGMTQTGQTGLVFGHQITYATGLVQAKMEESLSMPYAELSRGGLEGEEDLGGFIRTRSILLDQPRLHCLTLRVTVEWRDKAGRPHRVQFATLRAEETVP